jgi:hypothetical protein
MLEQSVLNGWKLLAEQNKMFHGKTILALLKHIKELEKIIDELTFELETKNIS